MSAGTLYIWMGRILILLGWIVLIVSIWIRALTDTALILIVGGLIIAKEDSQT